MRPRQSSLGIVADTASFAPPERCFNEAEAIKPRNHEAKGDPFTITGGLQ